MFLIKNKVGLYYWKGDLNVHKLIYIKRKRNPLYNGIFYLKKKFLAFIKDTTK